MLDVIKEYLVSIGFAVNANQFNQVNQKLGALEGMVNSKSASMVKGLAGVASALTAVSAGITALVVKTAQSELGYQKWGRQMWMNTEAAKTFKMSLDAMGESMEDIAWNPELRKQFFELKGMANQMQGMLPGDYKSSMYGIRQLLFGVKMLKLEMGFAMQWISYYLIKYFDGPLRNIKKIFSDINKNFVGKMPEWTKKAASYLASVINVFVSGIRFVKDLSEGVKRFFESIPKGARLAIVGLMALWAVLASGPMGMIIAGLSFLLLLIEDFYAYMDGRKSSKTFAPVWKELLKLNKETDGFKGFVDLFKVLVQQFKELFDTFDNNNDNVSLIFQLVKTFNDMAGAVAHLTGAFQGLNALNPFQWLYNPNSPMQKSLHSLLRLILSLVDALALLAQGRFKEAGKVAKEGLMKFGNDIMDQNAETQQTFKRTFGAEQHWVASGKENPNIKGLKPQTMSALNLLSDWFYEKTGKKLTVTSGKRTWGSSGHKQGLKFDVSDPAFKNNRKLRNEFMDYARSMGLVVLDEYDHPSKLATGGHLDINAKNWGLNPSGMANNQYYADPSRSYTSQSIAYGGLQIATINFQLPNGSESPTRYAIEVRRQLESLLSGNVGMSTRDMAGVVR